MQLNLRDSKGHPVNLVLNEQQISCSAMKKPLDLSEVIGASVSGDTLTLHYFKAKPGKSDCEAIHTLIRRKIKEIRLICEAGKAEFLRSEVIRRLHSPPRLEFPGWQGPDGRICYKRALVFVNPGSGKGEAPKKAAKFRRLLAAHGAWAEELISEGPEFVERFIASLPREKLLSFHVIVCFSGDGTPHQALNALMRRPDFCREMLEIPVMIFPCGSGCALSENASKLSGVQNSTANSLFALCNFRRLELPLIRNSLIKNGVCVPVYSFLFTIYGYMADLNHESEALRFLGENRFKVYGYWKILGKFNPKIKLVLPNSSPAEPLPPAQAFFDPQSFSLLDSKIFSFYASSLPFITRGHLSSPGLMSRLGGIDLQVFEEKFGKLSFAKYLLQHERHSEASKPLIQKKENLIRLYLDPKRKNLIIDGESYAHVDCEYVQVEDIGLRFFTLY